MALLLDHPMTMAEIAGQLGISKRDVADDIAHLLKSLERSDYDTIVTPAKCRKCGFTFEESKLKKPGRCPQCRSTWIEPPRVEVRSKQA